MAENTKIEWAHDSSQSEVMEKSQAQHSPSQLIAALGKLMRRFPAYSSILKTARLAVTGQISDLGTHSIILAAIEDGANTYADLEAMTGFSSSHLHRNLNQLISAGLVRQAEEPVRGNFRPRKLFFLVKEGGE
jgi:predicted HTH transcriptional regulator